MPIQQNSRVSNFFDEYAKDFSAIYGNDNSFLVSFINRIFRKSMRLRFIKTLEGCSPVDGRSILDVGCGPGHYSIALARMGAKRVLGIDFAEGMLKLASENARRLNVEKICCFQKNDFVAYNFEEDFDYTILMGIMDYIEKPEEMIQKVLSVTKVRAFFSFPLDGGLLAWQRKLRYSYKCALFMYMEGQIIELFSRMNHRRLEIQRNDRELFVTAHML